MGGARGFGEFDSKVAPLPLFFFTNACGSCGWSTTISGSH